MQLCFGRLVSLVPSVARTRRKSLSSSQALRYTFATPVRRWQFRSCETMMEQCLTRLCRGRLCGNALLLGYHVRTIGPALVIPDRCCLCGRFECVGVPLTIWRTSMIRGSCLCGGVQLEIARAVGPFELCHCNRCRKASGSAFVAGLRVLRDDFRLLQGRELITTYEAPIWENPPAYRTSFCSRCGSPVPCPFADSPWFEVPAGLLDDDPQLRPDKHIFVELKSPWFTITDNLPQLDKKALLRLRQTQMQP